VENRLLSLKGLVARLVIYTTNSGRILTVVDRLIGRQDEDLQVKHLRAFVIACYQEEWAVGRAS
jgi:hypothetical protein